MQTEPLLRKLANHRPEGRSSFAYDDPESGWSVRMTTEAADALSVQLWDVSVSRPAPQAPLPAAAVHEAAQRVADRVTGLMEPLRLLEVDAERGEAVLRSDSPTVRKDRRAHYELKIAGTHRGELRRHQAGVEPAAKREQVPFTLTKEVLSKYLEDLTEALR